jgi:hypothetical protein
VHFFIIYGNKLCKEIPLLITLFRSNKIALDHNYLNLLLLDSLNKETTKSIFFLPTRKAVRNETLCGVIGCENRLEKFPMK